jgi:hypothetical protein
MPVVPGVIAALLWCALALAQTWTTVLVQPGRFSVELPAKHRYEQKGALHQYVVEINQRAFVVQGGAYPWNVDLSDPRARLEADLATAARDLNDATWTEVKWTTFGEQPAFDAVGRRDNTTVRSFSTLNGSHFVVLTYAGPAGTERAPEVERFIASLRRTR